MKQGTKIPVQTRQQHGIGAVRRRGAGAGSDAADHRGWHGLHGRDGENDQIDQAIPRVQGIPAIDTQSAETKVTVNDGATVVIGGIIVTNQQTDVKQVPLFGSMPVVGNLFKHTTVSSHVPGIALLPDAAHHAGLSQGGSRETAAVVTGKSRRRLLNGPFHRSRIERLRFFFPRLALTHFSSRNSRTSSIFADLQAAQHCCLSNNPAPLFSRTVATRFKPMKKCPSPG